MFEHLINDKFIADIGRSLKRKLTEEQAQTIRLLIQEAEIEGIKDRNKIAYILGTCWRECLFKPIEEIRAKPGTQVWRWQNRYWPSGYYGRGYIQLTLYSNYKKFGKLLGIDLVGKPELALVPEIGAKILILGMNRGLFTGVGLSKYFVPCQPPDWINARKIVNGTYHADKVAAASIKFLSVIVANSPEIV